MRDLPNSLEEAQVTVYDFNTGEELAAGFANVRFLEHSDKLRVMRNLFEGHFTPSTEEEGQNLRRRLFTGLSQGAPAMSMHLEYGGETWVFVVKFQLEDVSFPFTGRAEPQRL